MSVRDADITPFLAAVAAASARPLGAALPAVAPASAPSPWCPRPVAPTAPPALEADAPDPARDLAALRAEASAAGWAEGHAAGVAAGEQQTAALRERLTAAAAALEAATAALGPPAAELIADAAAAVVGAWTEAAPRRELFAPIARAWVARCRVAATARVCPDEVDALRAALAEVAEAAAVDVVGDPAIAPGDVRIASGELELRHAWDDRLPELREAIVAALTEAPAARAADAEPRP